MEEWNLNIMLVIVAVAVLFKIVVGYGRGMVKELVSLISLIILCVVAALIAYGVTSYNAGRIFNVIVIVILLLLLVTAHHLLGILFFSAKLATKLPVVHFVDKLLGIVFGAFEVVLMLWTLYAFMMMMDIGSIRQVILKYTEESIVLTWLYEHNYLARGIEGFLERFRFIPLVEWMEFIMGNKT